MTQSNLVRAFVLANSLWAMAALGQAIPSQLSFTGNLVGSGGPTTGAHNFVFRLLDAPTNGNVSWTETQNNLQVTNGIVYTTLGGITPFTPSILNGSALYLEISVDGTALAPRVQILSVPFAIRAGVAASANTLGNLTPADVQKRVTGTCSGNNAIQVVNADGTVGCSSGTGDITSIVTPGTGGLTGGTTAGDATLSVDGTVQRRGGSGSDMTCAAGKYIQSIAATGAPVCADDTGVINVSAGSGISASIANRSLTIANTGLLSASSANNFITAAIASGALTITANVGTTVDTLAAGNHGHTLNCGSRAVNAGSATSVTVTCAATEELVGGGCNSDGNLSVSNPFNSCPGGGFCFCLAGSKCYVDSWRCGRTSGTTLTAFALCCDSTVRGNVP